MPDIVAGGIYMSAVKIIGKNKLDGSVRIQGCKNSVLPIIAASVVSGGRSVIHNCPRLSDVFSSIAILRDLGAKADLCGNTLTIDSSGVNSDTVRPELMSAMRSSVIFLGALLSRCGAACISMPGGCDIGARPIDIHLDAFSRLGVDVDSRGTSVCCSASNLHGGSVVLPFPSVGATENIMLLSCVGRGVTTIYNAAKEPEIEDLQNFLNGMGARVFGAGSGVITIYAAKKLYDIEYTVMPDRIEAATFACAAAAAGGSVYMNPVVPEHISPVLNVLEGCGAKVVRYASSLLVVSDGMLNCAPFVATGPYPGFPTDAQSLVMSVMSVSHGSGVIVENIFENRLRHAYELCKMGADISVHGRRAVINGGELHGAHASACDLRSGAALAVAAFAADGETRIDKAEYINRGYDGFTEKFRSIGANIEGMNDDG